MPTACAAILDGDRLRAVAIPYTGMTVIGQIGSHTDATNAAAQHATTLDCRIASTTRLAWRGAHTPLYNLSPLHLQYATWAGWRAA